jgi:hypothetical protein
LATSLKKLSFQKNENWAYEKQWLTGLVVGVEFQDFALIIR